MVKLGLYGRTPPPPPGKIFVRNSALAWGRSIVEAVNRYKAAGEQVPEHLVGLAQGVPADLPESPIELADSDFGVPPAPFASAEPLQPAQPEPGELEEEEAEQEEEAEEEEVEGVDLEGWTVPELKGALDQIGVDYPANARKSELIALLQEAEQ